MEFYLPSFFLVLLAFLISFMVIPRSTPLILAVIAGVALVAALYNHSALFSMEWQRMATTSQIGKYAPIILVGAVVVFSIGFILLSWSSGKGITLPSFTMTIPPPNTATNVVTEAVGNTLAATNVSNVNKGYSISPSLEKNVTNANIQSALESRYARAV